MDTFYFNGSAVHSGFGVCLTKRKKSGGRAEEVDEAKKKYDYLVSNSTLKNSWFASLLQYHLFSFFP